MLQRLYATSSILNFRPTNFLTYCNIRPTTADLRYNGPTAAKKQLENHVQVGQKCNIEDMRRAKSTPP